MNLFLFYLIILATSILASGNDIRIDSDDDCWTSDGETITQKSDSVLVKFSSKVAYGKSNCSIEIANPWPIDAQHGFAVFLSRSMDCGSLLFIQCLTENLAENQSFPLSKLLNCQDGEARVEMPCSSIRLTYKRDLRIDDQKRSTNVQVTSLIKGPCLQKNRLFACREDFPDSCLNANLKCNGRAECPSGGDERRCPAQGDDGMSIVFVILVIVGCLFLICVASIVGICCCCGAVFNRFSKNVNFRNNRTRSEKEKEVVTNGEDAGLMRALETNPLPAASPPTYAEASALVIDSTKPIYPRLE